MSDKPTVTPMCGECGRPIPDRQLHALLAVEAAARAMFEDDLADPAQRDEVIEMIACALSEIDDT